MVLLVFVGVRNVCVVAEQMAKISAESWFAWGNIHTFIPSFYISVLIPRIVNFVISVFQMLKFTVLDYFTNVSRPEWNRFYYFLIL